MTLLPTHPHNISTHFTQILNNIVGGLKHDSWYRSACWQIVIHSLAGRIKASPCLAGSKFAYCISNRICLAMVGSWSFSERALYLILTYIHINSNSILWSVYHLITYRGCGAEVMPFSHSASGSCVRWLMVQWY